MNDARVRDLLVRQAGLAEEALGPAVLPPAVGRRMRALQLTSLPAYVALLEEEPDKERQALLEELVVPETWFFRGGDVFAYLAEHARRVVQARPAGPPFRALSIPCSTGEEPASLAIALLEAGVPRQAWALQGVDLSERHLERARRGEYGELAFRQTPPELRQRYFRPSGAKWALSPATCSAVRYRRGNLVAPDFLLGEGPFDLVLCRNLFIYLTPEARVRALDNIDRLLAPEGLLGLGHAEPLALDERRFQRFGPEAHFLYGRASALPSGRAPAPPVTKPPGWEGEPPAEPVAGPRPPGLRPALPVEDDLLARAHSFANGGRLDEALVLCRDLLARAAPTAEAYCLLGVVHQALHHSGEAKACFQKALYLAPAHREALLHLMLLHQQEGDLQRAALLRRRWERAAGGEP